MHAVYKEGLTKAAKRAIWDKVVEDFNESSEGMTAYSRQQGLNYDHLSYYVNAHRRKQTKESSFIQLGELAPTLNSSIKITYGSVTIELPSSASAKQLASLAKELSC